MATPRASAAAQAVEIVESEAIIESESVVRSGIGVSWTVIRRQKLARERVHEPEKSREDAWRPLLDAAARARFQTVSGGAAMTRS
jgi:hypothetical protein